MRVFVAGASGAIGRRLVPQLIDAGHEVIGTHNSPSSAELLRTLGARPVRLDLLDAGAVRKAVLESEPEAIVHEATALANVKFARNMDKVTAKTSELRTKGTDALLAAAREAGVRRFVAQSVARFSRYAREGGPIKTEDDPLDPTPPSALPAERRRDGLSRAGGHRLRRDRLALRRLLRRRQRRHDRARSQAAVSASSATAAASGRGSTSTTPPPQPFSPWTTTARRSTTSSTTIPRRCANGLPVLAQALGAKPPRRVPTWLARLLAGETVTVMSTEARGASNAKAKRELGWTPRYPTWRTGFAAVYSAIAEAEQAQEPALDLAA